MLCLSSGCILMWAKYISALPPRIQVRVCQTPFCAVLVVVFQFFAYLDGVFAPCRDTEADGMLLEQFIPCKYSVLGAHLSPSALLRESHAVISKLQSSPQWSEISGRWCFATVGSIMIASFRARSSWDNISLLVLTTGSMTSVPSLTSSLRILNSHRSRICWGVGYRGNPKTLLSSRRIPIVGRILQAFMRIGILGYSNPCAYICWVIRPFLLAAVNHDVSLLYSFLGRCIWLSSTWREGLAPTWVLQESYCKYTKME